ncbi:AraC family transcriptional regulator [Flavobacterium ginsenosidimutans]|uniref:Helix-turn-helix transcriptional regulator n=1 Tax=Flavobacterium ginsenosidimutans TaxID=687844 RepID=A0ABZ2Q551_9FLAO|nr:AraC family transcriptional regulator [Flavobacterium ginsenosidimutans]KAF2333537.1 helix-turn-helix transcriptional regulator [Flavobacterium ginsenosidimutans]
MKALSTGQFFGETNSLIVLDGLTITDTEYTHEKVDWHYHEKPYFTFILQGRVLEGNKKEIYQCSQGSLLFHNWDDAHYNIKPPGFTRGFHIEINQDWFKNYSLKTEQVQGSISIKNTGIQLLFYKIFKESKLDDSVSNLTINTLLIEVLEKIDSKYKTEDKFIPHWAKTLKEILHEQNLNDFSLPCLAKLLDIHPVHLSRCFPKYFGCSLGEYIRKIKIKKSIGMLSDNRSSLAEIALEAGFSDQSHFNRCFKENIGTTPMNFRNLLL